jgi:hypothetical protein
LVWVNNNAVGNINHGYAYENHERDENRNKVNDDRDSFLFPLLFSTRDLSFYLTIPFTDKRFTLFLPPPLHIRAIESFNPSNACWPAPRTSPCTYRAAHKTPEPPANDAQNTHNLLSCSDRKGVDPVR